MPGYAERWWQLEQRRERGRADGECEQLAWQREHEHRHAGGQLCAVSCSAITVAVPELTHTTPESCARKLAKYQNCQRQPVASRPLKLAQNDCGTMAKTYKHLHEQVYDFGALYGAWERARCGKRYREDVLAFGAKLGENLLALEDELRDLTWQPGAYRQQVVRSPKPRVIHVAPFRDRIVHQSLCAVVAPLFEETFIYDSYACRIGRGSHAAVDRLTQFLRQGGSDYVLKGDLRKFFDSIPHGLIMRELEWRIGDGAILDLLRRVLDSYQSDFQGPEGFGPRGVPIGNLTSQWFANIVGNCLDQHVKHELKCRRYVRYMDDFLLIGDDKAQLRAWLNEIERLLVNLGLVLNPKTCIMPTRLGVPFLGYRVWADHRRVLRPSVVRGRRRMRGQLERVKVGALAGVEAVNRLRNWFAHLRHADTYHLRKRLWGEARNVLEGYL